MATTCDKESVRQAYESVRDDKTDVNWQYIILIPKLIIF